MPRGDGTGPDRRKGRGQGKQIGYAGPGGNCVCPTCGHKEKHKRGQPCNEQLCPVCGIKMVREE